MNLFNDKRKSPMFLFLKFIGTLANKCSRLRNAVPNRHSRRKRLSSRKYSRERLRFRIIIWDWVVFTIDDTVRITGDGIEWLIHTDTNFQVS